MPLPPSSVRTVNVIAFNPYAAGELLTHAAAALAGLDPFAVDDVVAAALAYDRVFTVEELRRLVREEGGLEGAIARRTREIAAYLESILRPPHDRSAAILALLFAGLTALESVIDKLPLLARVVVLVPAEA